MNSAVPAVDSGPLQIGHTRMSSSRESMNSFQYEFREGRVEFGLDSHRNQVAPAEVAAFYRILFGHQHESQSANSRSAARNAW